MRHEAATREILRIWKAIWQASSQAALPIEFPNLKFKQPSAAPWGRLSIVRGKTSAASLGSPSNPMKRTPFILTLQIFIPEHAGTRLSEQAADAMSGLDNQTTRLPGLVIRFEEASLETAGSEEGFERFNITLAGQYDATAD